MPPRHFKFRCTCTALFVISVTILLGTGRWFVWFDISTPKENSSMVYLTDLMFGNFQMVMRETPVEEDDYLIPNDDELDRMTEKDFLEVYWKYIQTVQVLCKKQMRLGAMADGGKEVCVDNNYKPEQPCLVYSMGSRFEFSFEEAVDRHFSCEIHTFDPGQPIAGHNIPSAVNFHLIGLGGYNTINNLGMKIMTLSSMRKYLNHTDRIIDILKIDIEGGEWNSLHDIVRSGVLNYVKQICVELHFGRSKPFKNKIFWGEVPIKKQIQVLRYLYDQGFRIFMREHVLYSTMNFKQPYGSITNQNEISFINVKWKTSQKYSK